jgi:hypothetical protein
MSSKKIDDKACEVTKLATERQRKLIDNLAKEKGIGIEVRERDREASIQEDARQI